MSTTTRTTTLVVLDVLTPVPLTGSWPAGQTFRTALKLAEALINEDQRPPEDLRMKSLNYSL